MKLPKKKFIDLGADSKVYKIKGKNQVIKVYHNLLNGFKNKLTLDNCLELVTNYNKDTLKAMDAIESKWDEDVGLSLNNFDYKVNFHILPQGEISVIDNYVVSIGQKYVPFPNLKNMIESNRTSYDAIRAQYTNIRQRIAMATQIIRDSLNIPFTIQNKNVKPILNDENKEIDFVITDLATNLVIDYKYYS